MKKLVIVALALVLAMTFVGCGAGAKLLEGTTWDLVESESSYLNGMCVRFSFEEEGVCKYYEVNNEEMLKDGSNAYDYTWAVSGADTLTINTSKKLYGEYTFVIVGDEMTWTQTLPEENKDEVLKLKRVTDAE